jgi:hypothetical protein
MKVKLFLLLSGVLLSGFSQAQDEPASDLSNTREAFVTLKIITDPKIFLLQEDLGAIRECFSARRRYDAAAEFVTDFQEDWFSDTIDSPKEIGGVQICNIQWSISLGEKDKPAAREVAENLVDRLREYLYEEYSQNMNIYREKERTYAQRASEAEERLRQMLEQRTRLGQGALDEASFRQRTQEHERALLENQVQRSVLTRRADQFARTIKQLTAMKNSAAPGGATGGGDSEAERDRQRHLGEEIARLDREHRNTQIELEEQNVIANKLGSRNPGKLAVQYELLSVQIEAAKENLKRALIEQEAFMTQMRLIQRPVVIEEIQAVMPSR